MVNFIEQNLPLGEICIDSAIRNIFLLCSASAIFFSIERLGMLFLLNILGNAQVCCACSFAPGNITPGLIFAEIGRFK